MQNGWRIGWVFSAMAMMAVFLTACNDDDKDASSDLDGYFESHPYVSDPRSSPTKTKIVSISPESATVNSVGTRVLFTASGGSAPYHWDRSNPTLGTIVASGEAQGIYTASAIGANDVIVYDQAGNAALARISGTAPAEPPEPPAPADMSISASPSTLTMNNAYSVLTVSGGTATFTWTVATSAKGNFSGSNTGRSVVYQRYLAGDNVVTVTDGNGNRTSRVIDQP
jgi:hypothetical protein